jgi:hypothetical protein
MNWLPIILLLVVFTAWRNKRPLKLVLTEDEAKAIKARWWSAAKTELKVWVIGFVIGVGLLSNALAAEHWHPLIYVGVVWASLIIFSRLALWLTVLAGLLLYGLTAITTTFGHPICPIIFAVWILGGCIYAMIIRCPLTFMFTKAMAHSAQMAAEQAAAMNKETLHYDKGVDRH